MKKYIVFMIVGIIYSHSVLAQIINSISGTANVSSPVFDNQCNMYYIDYESKIKKMSAIDGTITTIAGTGTWGTYNPADDGGPAISADIEAIWLAIDNENSLYFSDNDNSVIRKVYTTGIHSGNIYRVAGTYPFHRGSGTSGDGGPATDAKLDYTWGLAVDNIGNLYIEDDGGAIRKVDASGYISLFAGSETSTGYSGDGGAANAALFTQVNGMKFNADFSKLYIGDASRVRVIDMTTSSYTITTVAGGGTSGVTCCYTGPATDAQLGEIQDVAIDIAGNIYLADEGSNVIRMVNTSGNISTVAGTGTMGLSGDAGLATAAELDVFFINTDVAGNYYISNGFTPPMRYVCQPVPPPLTITSIPNSSTAICAGSSITFTANPVNGGCGLGFTWYKLIGGSWVNVGTGLTYTDASASLDEEVYCTETATGNYINGYCSSTTVATSNTIVFSTVNTLPQITGIDINNVCAPYTSGSCPACIASPPQYAVTMACGACSYSYNWSPDVWSGSTINDATIANPTVTALTSDLLLDRYLTVTDIVTGCTTSHEVVTKFITSGWDLATRDNPFDLYMEPFVMANPGRPDWNIWNSPSIWNRNTLGAGGGVNEPPNYTASANYLYFTIKNVGCEAFPSITDGVSMRFYWTIGNFAGAETWSSTAGMNDWTDATYSTVCGTTSLLLPLGKHINYSTIPIDYPINGATLPGDLAPGETFTNPMGISWQPPYPTCYAATMGIAPNTIDLCFLSRLVDNHNLAADPVFGMSYAEMDGSEKYNVINNNNISTINTTDMYLSGPSPYSPIHHVFTGYSYGYTGPVSLQFANDYSLYPGTGTSVLNQYMSMTIYLGDSLFNKWYNAGAYGTYTSYDYNKKWVTFDGTNTVQLDSIVMDSGALYMITIAPGLISGIDGSSMPAEMVHFRTLKDDTTTEVLGCYNYNVVYHPAAPGVLTVTELSLGPNSPLSCTGSQYAELLVNNCGTDAGQQVDISNWIFDDNSGNFDMEGCADGLGITRGHYRFANIDLWHNVPVGSRIVLYNGTANCYNLPDTFTYDTANSIFWIPVPDTNATKDYVLQRYAGSENVSMCSYCSDTAITTYTDAYGWMNTINFDTLHDAVQVRCPGCSKAFTGTPSFYQGMGYDNTIGSGYMSITANMNELGGPVDYSAPPVMPRKFVFTGKDSSDFHQSSLWLASIADTAGVVPPGLGYVSDSLQYKSVHHLLNLPCCNYSAIGGRKSSKGSTKLNTALQTITVYPNPAHTELNFALLQTDNAQINLFTITGQLVRSININNSNLGTIQVSGLPPGLYIYKAVTNSKTQTGKIVIE